MHPDEIKIALYYENRLDEAEKRSFENHLSDCGECAGILADLIKINRTASADHLLHVEQETFDRAKQLVTGKIKKHNSQLVYALPGLVAIFLITFTFIIRNNQAPPSSYRSNENTGHSIIMKPANESKLTPDKLIFEWSSVENAIGYHFLLYNTGGKLLWNSLLQVTTTTLPDTIDLPENSKYLWRVEIIFPDNSKERSRLNVFTLEK